MSKTICAYEVVKKNRIWIDQTRFSEPVRSIHENAPSGIVRFVFEDNSDLIVQIGDELVIK